MNQPLKTIRIPEDASDAQTAISAVVQEAERIGGYLQIELVPSADEGLLDHIDTFITQAFINCLVWFWNHWR